MGLHAQIHQVHEEVAIALCGEIRAPELDQLRAILTHFHRRGCRRFLLDLSQTSPFDPAAEAALSQLIGHPGFPTTKQVHGSAIRLLADTPAARPQTGRGAALSRGATAR